MKFRTECKTEPKRILSPERGVTLLGSCFADNIRGRMRRCLWNADNPFGVLFNPFSIATAVEIALNLTGNDPAAGNALPNPHVSAEIRDSIFQDGEFFHSWLFDSKVSGGSAEEVERKILSNLSDFSRRLRCFDTLIITFGTAWCYFLKEREDKEREYRYNDIGDGYVVANCHKQPQSLFERKRIGIDEIARLWIELADRLKGENPDLKIIFTVSPIRHMKDGFEGNTRSKAVLQLAVEEICGQRDFCIYFPAYEFLLDDLRDYRFYADDLVHPSEMAVEYIWEKFCDTFLDESGRALLKEGEALARRAAHRGIMPDTAADMRFRSDTRMLAERFAASHPAMLGIGDKPDKI